MTAQSTRPEETETLDTSGLLCPLPVYKAAMALRQLEEGDVLKLICTDPGSLQDIPALAHQRGDVLLSTEAGDGVQTFWLQKGTTQ